VLENGIFVCKKKPDLCFSSTGQLLNIKASMMPAIIELIGWQNPVKNACKLLPT